MLEIWTEDTGAGYHITKSMMEAYYDRKHINVKSHDGNGNNVPKGETDSHGGLLYDLIRNRNNPNTIIILMDMALDNSDVTLNIDSIESELQFHNKNHRLIGLYCFEYGMLTYKNLHSYGGFDDNYIKSDISIFLKCIKRGCFNYNLIPKEESSYFSNLVTSRDKSGEVIAKALLSRATNRANIKLNKKNIHGAMIQGDRVGACWKCDCCIYNKSIRGRLCDADIRNKVKSTRNKMLHLLKYSDFGKYILWINSIVEENIKLGYRGNINSSLEVKSKERVMNMGLKPQQLNLIILDYLQKHNGTWNFIQISNAL